MSADAGYLNGHALGRSTSGAWRMPAMSAGAVLTGVLFLALNLQMLTFSGELVVSESGGGPALKVYHAVFGCVGLIVLLRGRLVRWRPEMVVYFGMIGATTLVASLHFGAQFVLANTVFAAYAAVIGATVGRMAGAGAALRVLRWTSVAVLLLVLAKGVLFLPEIIRFLAAPNGHPLLPTFYGGGPNLEATWVGMSGVFLIGSRLFLPYMALSAALSVAYASRVGLIVVMLVMGGSIVGGWLRSGRKLSGSSLVLPLCVLLIGAVAITAAQDIDGADYIAQRFQNIGEDPGSTSRFTLWTGSVRVFTTYPLGVGIGNAVPLIERMTAMSITEDNVHNQYLQHLVDTGIQGLLVYLALVGLTWRRLLRSRLQDPMLLYVGIYFVLAMIQFRGAEALLWFIYGLQTGTETLIGEAHAA
ncbi:MAG TPA: O-antigen ligase family protein [Gemmatimonadaceae bacterium]|nr:O-antigen ligase family protein [Gemmatimonadaceae bacterium]